MKQYLLDTCICVFLLRKKYGIEKRLEEIEASQCYISEVTIAELIYGAYKSDYVEYNLDLINRFISRVHVVPFIDAIDFYAREKNRLRAMGTPVEDFDLLIASSAVSHDLILVTDNLKHFRNISGLKVENWVNRGE